MDVTCERCGTEYEFDETLVSDRGTTVKCTHCGHLFKVYRPGGPSPGGGERTWQLMRSDGSTETLSSLRELQRRITQGQLGEDDRISRSGGAWKRLGDIAELQTFFAAARAARGEQDAGAGGGEAPAPPGAGRRDHTLPFAASSTARPTPPSQPPQKRDSSPHSEWRNPPTPGSVSQPQPQPPRAPPPAGREGKRTMLGMGGVPADPQAQGTPPAPAESPPIPDDPTLGDDVATIRDPSRSSLGRASTVPEGSVVGGPPAGARPSTTPAERAGAGGGGRAAPGPSTASKPPAPSTTPAGSKGAAAKAPAARPLYVDDHDQARPPERGRGRFGLWLALVLLLAAGGGVAFGWEHIAPVLGLTTSSDRLNTFLQAGEQALVDDHVDAYDAAVREFTRATAMDETHPEALTGLARAHAYWAQALSFQADDLGAREGSGAEAAHLRREQQRHADQARRHAEDAVRRDPSRAAAEIALADALRLTGDLDGAKKHLERAREMQAEPSAELLRVRALIAAAGEAPGALEVAREDAQRAVERDPDNIRARLLLARALLASGDVSAARRHVDAVLEGHGDHPGAGELKRAIDQGIPPAKPVLEVLDAGAASQADAAVDEGHDTDDAEAVNEAADASENGTSSADERAGQATGSRGGAGDSVPSGRDYDWYVRRGEELLERGDVGRARRHFEKATALRGTAPEAQTGLGYVALNEGQASLAIRRFQPAANAGYGEAYIGLGTAYRELARYREAIEAYERYLARNSGGPHASIAQSQIQQLKPKVEKASDPPADRGSGTEGASASEDLPAPEGTDTDRPPPESDSPAVESEP